MSITIEQVEKIARLAKLSFSDEEKEKFVQQFNQIITYIEKLNELNTENVPPTSHVLNLKNVMREDKSEHWLTQEEALANAPVKKGKYFSVPKVIK